MAKTKEKYKEQEKAAVYDFPAFISVDSSYLAFLYQTVLGRMLLQPLTSRPFSVLAGKFMDSSLSTNLIPGFIRSAKITMEDYLPEDYRSFNQFFTRRIRPEARPIDEEPTHLVSPADAKLSVYPLTEDAVFFIKGVPYSAEQLVRSPAFAKRFRGGYCFIFRLAVDDYHRYAFPDSGRRTRYVHIPGIYHTVQPIALDYADIYRQNTREYTCLRTDNFGDILFMQVGARLVGRLCNEPSTRRFARGEEAGHFDYGGSTIVMFTEKDAVIPHPVFLSRSAEGIESVVRLGQCIGCAPQKKS